MAKNRSKEETERLKDYAKTLFTQDRLSQKEVAIKSGISEATISKWVVAGNWSKLQRNFLLTREEQMANLLDELAELNAHIKKKAEGLRFADSKEGDVRRKLIRDIKDLETKASLPEVIASCKGLLDFVRKIDLATAQSFSKLIDGYIKSLL